MIAFNLKETFMRKTVFLSVFILGLLASRNTSAGRISINPFVTFTPYNAQAQLCNYTGRPVVCHMNLNAQTSFGGLLHSFLNNTAIYPGQCTYTFLQNYTSYPIINAWATSWCNFLP